MKPIYLLLGFVFFGLGAVGVVLPGLPTTPLLLLALWAFSRSSDRFHDWLYAHPVFGLPLQRWRQHRVIPLPAKLFALAMMAASLVYLALYAEVPAWLVGLVAAIMGYGAWFILTKPSRPARAQRAS